MARLSPPTIPNSGRFGFTLVEVVLALGVAAFGILAIAALVPAGLRSNLETREESISAQIFSAIDADLQALPTDSALPTSQFKLPNPRVNPAPTPATTTYTIYADWQIVPDASGPAPPTSSTGASAICRLHYERHGQQGGSRSQPYCIRLRLAWPVEASEANAGFIFETLTAVRP